MRMKGYETEFRCSHSMSWLVRMTDSDYVIECGPWQEPEKGKEGWHDSVPRGLSDDPLSSQGLTDAFLTSNSAPLGPLSH